MKPGRAFPSRQAGRVRSFQERDLVFSVRGRDCLRKRGQVHYDREGEKDAREVLTMRLAGRISDWNDDKGYGFVTPNGGGGRAFVHIKAFQPGSRRPVDGDLVSYAVTRDGRGRSNASEVRFAGQRITQRKPARQPTRIRSEERRVGKECVGTGRSRWSAEP